MTSPADHAATVRDAQAGIEVFRALCKQYGVNMTPVTMVDAAIVALADRATELEREIAKWRNALDNAVLRERAIGDNERKRAKRAETALREIRMCSDDERVIRIARAALGETAPRAASGELREQGWKPRALAAEARATELERERDDLKRYRDAETRALAERAERAETALRPYMEQHAKAWRDDKRAGECICVMCDAARATLGETAP